MKVIITVVPPDPIVIDLEQYYYKPAIKWEDLTEEEKQEVLFDFKADYKPEIKGITINQT